MKVIVTGATGSAGQGIVEACLADERITKIIIVTRRNVAGDVESNDKVEVVLHSDFSEYPDELMTRLEGVEACLWAIGGTAREFENDEVARKVGVDYTLAGARAMRDKIASNLPEGKIFRFVYVSGMLSEWDQDKTLYFMGSTRHIKGSAEKGLVELAREGEAGGKSFETYIARPAALIGINTPAWKAVFSPLSQGMKTVQLGRAMIRLALGEGKQQITDVNDLKELAREA